MHAYQAMLWRDADEYPLGRGELALHQCKIRLDIHAWRPHIHHIHAHASSINTGYDHLAALHGNNSEYVR